MKINDCARLIRQKKSRIAVFGVCNIDILLQPKEITNKLCDSAGITLYVGGVGRNVAIAASYLGCEVDFFTALDSDNIWSALCKRELEREDVRVQEVLSATNAFCAIKESGKGDKGQTDNIVKGYYDDGGISDWSEALLHWQKENANNCRYDAIVIESALLKGAGGSKICDNFIKRGLKVALIGTAAGRTEDLHEMLGEVYLLQLNKAEILGLLPQKKDVEYSYGELAAKINGLGVANVLLSQGADGVYCGRGGTVQKLTGDGENEDAKKYHMGTGDSLFAGALSALLVGCSLAEAAEFGMHCAEHTCESEEMVSRKLKKLSTY